MFFWFRVVVLNSLTGKDEEWVWIASIAPENSLPSSDSPDSTFVFRCDPSDYNIYWAYFLYYHSQATVIFHATSIWLTVKTNGLKHTILYSSGASRPNPGVLHPTGDLCRRRVSHQSNDYYHSILHIHSCVSIECPEPSDVWGEHISAPVLNFQTWRSLKHQLLCGFNVKQMRLQKMRCWCISWLHRTTVDFWMWVCRHGS